MSLYARYLFFRVRSSSPAALHIVSQKFTNPVRLFSSRKRFSISDIQLNCVIYGKIPTREHIFSVDIARSRTVGKLKNLIKEKNQEELGKFDAANLTLWHVNMPAEEIAGNMLELFKLKDNAEVVQRLDNSLKRLSSYFPANPDEEHLHIIVEPPFVPLHIPAKRELEFSLEPLKRPKREFPVDAIRNFKVVMDNNYFYADKTKYIKEIEHDRKVLMFLRPKRFGKSLLLSTLKHFYDINETQNFDRLFGSLDIYQHASELQHNQFLILEWDFSRINRCASIDKMEQSLRDYINETIGNFCDSYANILGKRSEDLQQLVINQDDCLASLERLFRQVRHCPYKIYLLIDEYDTITNEFLDPADVLSYKQLRDKQSLLKAIFGVIKAHCTEEISQVFITGVSPLSMNDITSGFNIRYDITLEPTYEHMYGLEEKDIQSGLKTKSFPPQHLLC